jgi:hypothetical protein
MGNCCSGAGNENEINMMQNGVNPVKNGADIFQKNSHIIVRIQAFFRGTIARKRVKQRFGFVAKTFSSNSAANMLYYQNGENNYDNPRV